MMAGANSSPREHPGGAIPIADSSYLRALRAVCLRYRAADKVGLALLVTSLESTVSDSPRIRGACEHCSPGLACHGVLSGPKTNGEIWL